MNVNSPSKTPSQKILPRVVAVVGCDGSGKSTLTKDLIKHLSQSGPTELVYLGQSSGNIAEWVNTLPIIGPCIRRYLVRKADRSHDKKTKTQDRATTVGIFLLSVWRAFKFRRMLSLSKRGSFILTDRYPQNEIPGFLHDGTGLQRIDKKSWLARKLLAREVRMYEWMAKHVPVIVIRLNVDVDTAHTRKPDHKYESLKKKISVLGGLDYNGARIVEIDACDSYDRVLAAALDAVDEANAEPQNQTEDTERSVSGTIKATGPI